MAALAELAATSDSGLGSGGRGPLPEAQWTMLPGSAGSAASREADDAEEVVEDAALAQQAQQDAHSEEAPTGQIADGGDRAAAREAAGAQGSQGEVLLGTAEVLSGITEGQAREQGLPAEPWGTFLVPGASSRPESCASASGALGRCEGGSEGEGVSLLSYSRHSVASTESTAESHYSRLSMPSNNGGRVAQEAAQAYAAAAVDCNLAGSVDLMPGLGSCTNASEASSEADAGQLKAVLAASMGAGSEAARSDATTMAGAQPDSPPAEVAIVDEGGNSHDAEASGAGPAEPAEGDAEHAGFDHSGSEGWEVVEGGEGIAQEEEGSGLEVGEETEERAPLLA
ncbi:hypothetical protein N2152v2_010626 [Parachlorella kessleri]